MNITPHYLLEAKNKSSNTWNFSIPNTIDSPAGFFDRRLGFFNIKRLRKDSVKPGDAIVSSVRTDGYSMSVHTVRTSGLREEPFNVKNLPSQGLKLEHPKERVDISKLYRRDDGRASIRGIYNLSDLKPIFSVSDQKQISEEDIKKELKSIQLEVVGVDFGLSKPFVKASGDIAEIYNNVVDRMVINSSRSFFFSQIYHSDSPSLLLQQE